MSQAGRLNGWGKLLATVLPLAVLGAVALIRQSEKVAAHERILETKANKETVNAQFQAILRELQGINARLDRREP